MWIIQILLILLLDSENDLELVVVDVLILGISLIILGFSSLALVSFNNLFRLSSLISLNF